MSDVMPKKDYEFIKKIQDYMLDSTNMKTDEAWNFAFRIYQSKEWLTKYLLDDTRNDIEYQQGRADTIELAYKWVEEQSRILRLQSDTYNDEECFGGWRAMEDTKRYLEKQLRSRANE